MAHKHKLLNPEAWLPTWARGRGLSVQKVRVHKQAGQRAEVTIDVNGEFDCADERSCRQLTIDPRFSRRDF